MPKYSNITGSTRGWRIARIEKYLDDEGRNKEAFAYGDDEKNILVWYDLEEFKKNSQMGLNQNQISSHMKTPGDVSKV